MARVVVIVAVAVAALLAGCGDDAGGQPSGKPDPPPKRFTTTIDNAWFPLKQGTTFVSEGVDGGAKVRDEFKVTRRTKVVNGARCVIIDDRTYKHGRVVERTSDYYTQDLHGNVWYFGEDTATLDGKGHVKSTEGSWRAGVKGARPGLFMPAHPRVGEAHYQEYYVGHAEDQYRVQSLTDRLSVPYGRFKNVLRTDEFTRIEPGPADHKYYARGVGQIAERSGDGSERLKLVRVVRS